MRSCCITTKASEPKRNISNTLHLDQKEHFTQLIHILSRFIGYYAVKNLMEGKFLESICKEDVWLIEILKNNCGKVLKQQEALFRSNKICLQKKIIIASNWQSDFMQTEKPVDSLLKTYSLEDKLIDFSGADFSGAKLAALKNSCQAVPLEGINLSRANFSNIDLNTMGISLLNLRNTNLESSNFTGANITNNIDFRGADLNKANFYGADLNNIPCSMDLSNAINLRLKTLKVYRINIAANLFILSPLTTRINYEQLKEIKSIYPSITHMDKCPSNITNFLIAERLYNIFMQEHQNKFCNIFIALTNTKILPELKTYILNYYINLICTELVYYEKENTQVTIAT